MNIHAARLYVSPRTRPLTMEEQETRRLSYALKDWTTDYFTEAAFTAAYEMAQLITAPCWLIPVPPRSRPWPTAASIATITRKAGGRSWKSARRNSAAADRTPQRKPHPQWT